MSFLRQLGFSFLVGTVSACAIYTEDLIGQDGSVGGTGGTGAAPGESGGSGGVVDSGGGSGLTGGSGGTPPGGTGSLSNNSGASGNGGGSSDGGTGGAETGGTGGVETGGTGSSGGTGGTGLTSGGGAPSGGGGMGGAGPTGGSGGTVAARCEPQNNETLDMIDDMSIPNNQIITTNGRKGNWMGFHGADIEVSPAPTTDGIWPSSPMTEIPDDPGNYAIHYTTEVTVSTPDPAETWHQFGFLLSEGESYDLQGYDGLMFCSVRGDSGVFNTLVLRLTTWAESPEDEEQFEATEKLVPDEWGVVKIPFPEAWPLDNAKNLEFIGNNGEEYDIWVDNIALYTDP